MKFSTTEQKQYEAIVADVQAYLQTLAPDLRTVSQTYVTALIEREFVQMMCLLPYWLTDLLPVSAEVAYRLGIAHFYICWYYHAQDDLLDNETPATTMLGAHLALLKAIEVYETLGLTRSPCWTDFQRLAHLSAETYALEMKTRFAHLSELNLDNLEIFTLRFAGNRVAVFCFNAIAQAYWAGYFADDPRHHDLEATLHDFMTARQIGDDVGDWLTDLQAGQLNYVSAQFIRRLHNRGIITAHQPLKLERLASYQIRDEDFWAEIEGTANQLHTQALARLTPYGDCALRTRLIESQMKDQAQAWEVGRTSRTYWRRLFGLSLETDEA
ncbi:MAG: hypothetical protein GWN55_14820 [Phycisphaerae bacterium]|nr:hypothetical protein [Phycisphaerae bacterium]